MRWSYPGYPVAPAFAAAFERQARVALPPSLKTIMAENDGGCPEGIVVTFDHPLKGSLAAGLVAFYPLVPEPEETGISELNELVAQAYPGFVAFAELEAGWLLALDYRNGPEPSVAVLTGSVPGRSVFPDNVVIVAPDFATFLDRFA